MLTPDAPELFPDDIPPPEDEAVGEDPNADEPPPAVNVQPAVPDPKAILLERALALCVAIGKAHHNPAEGARWDPAAAAVLWHLIGTTHEKTPDEKGVRVPHAAIAGACNLSTKQVRLRLELLAAFGLIKCENQKEAGRARPFQVGAFFFNPLMVQLCVRRGGRKLSRGAIDPFLAMGLARNPRLRRPQGFQGFDVEFGEVEPSPGSPESLGRELGPWATTVGSELDALEEAAQIATASAASKGLRQQERLRRAAAAESFIRGCATVWQQAHERAGRGSARPAWEGPYDDQLSPENKKQFRELKALFERYGGSATAMAWACFVNYVQDLDDKGRPKFDPAKPHVQWVSSDKKPSHFAKHFDAVMMDPVVKRLSADQGSRARIAEIVGKTFDHPPAPPLVAASAKGVRG